MSEPRRPFSLTITALGIFLLAMWNLWRALIVAQQRAMLQELETTLDPRVRLALSVMWAVVFLLLALGLWQRRAAVRGVLPLAVLFYGTVHLGLMLLAMPAPAARQGWPLALLAVVAAVGWSAWLGLHPRHSDLWLAPAQKTAAKRSHSPFKVQAVQRGYHGESED